MDEGLLAGPPLSVLCVHGAGGGGWEWTIWRRVFEAAGVRVEAPDLMPAAAGLAHTRFEHYRSQVFQALARLPRPRVLVGASLGGLLSASCAEHADALVLVNPLPPAPWHSHLPQRTWPDVVPWGQDARLTSTHRALPDADDAMARLAFSHWRDESGEVLRRSHAGIRVAVPACPVLCVASMVDDEVPPALTAALATDWRAEMIQVPAVSHVGPLLGRGAADCAARVLAWLSTR